MKSDILLPLFSKCGKCDGSGYIPEPQPIPEYDYEGNVVDVQWEWEWECCPDCRGTGKPLPDENKEGGDGEKI